MTTARAPSSSTATGRQAPARCAACGDALDVVDTRPAMAHGFTLATCARCGTRRTLPDLDDDEVGAHYPPAYWGEGNRRFVAPIEALVRRLGRGRAGLIDARAPKPSDGLRRVLDVGCGRGETLARLRALGFTSIGVELSDVSARHARDTLGLDVRSTLHDPTLPAGGFCAVSFWHSLEHLRDADTAVARAAELLVPGGLLVVAVPNAASVQARLFKERWFHLDVPRHYHHFTASSLTLLLERHGFAVDSVSHLNLEQNPYGFLQSALNALGFPENFLYAMLKTPSARQQAVEEHPLLAAATVALAPALAPLSLLASLAESAVGRGGTLALIATRR